jgi:hypothetical protein
MRPFALPVVASIALLALPAVSSAQASVDIHIGLPVVLPQLVVVSPGVQVVPEVDEEVFFTNGYYWVRRDRAWYRSRVHTGRWVAVPGRVVPARLVKVPPGKYRRWKPAHHDHGHHDHDRGHHDHDRGHHDRDRGHGGDDHGHGKHARHGKHGGG